MSTERIPDNSIPNITKYDSVEIFDTEIPSAIPQNKSTSTRNTLQEKRWRPNGLPQHFFDLLYAKERASVRVFSSRTIRGST